MLLLAELLPQQRRPPGQRRAIRAYGRAASSGSSYSAIRASSLFSHPGKQPVSVTTILAVLLKAGPPENRPSPG
jgi:hypothetical protein